MKPQIMKMKRTESVLVLVLVVAFTWAAELSADSKTIKPRLSILENKVIRIGVDLNRGGSITYLADARTRENVVNTYDLGREIQQSYYSGPREFGNSHHPKWEPWGWNPIGAGDVFGNPARVLKHTNDGKTLYVKSIPKQWALKNVDGKCTFETWIKLDGTAARVRCRLVNNRRDKKRYPARHQELPAVYTIGKLHRLMTYDGSSPFENKPLREIKNAGPPWVYWKATENWATLVNDQDWGLGIFHVGTFQFVGGFSGKPNTGGQLDAPTGYIAPLHTEIIDHNIVYEYEYALILGWLKDIRAWVYQRRPKSNPDFRFENNRQHWRLINLSDSGFPIRGRLRLIVSKDDPQLISPPVFWKASEVPKLYIRAAYRTKQRTAELFWMTRANPRFDPKQSLRFEVMPDGKTRTYEVDLASASHYRGIITGLRLDPVASGNPGESVELFSISSKSE